MNSKLASSEAWHSSSPNEVELFGGEVQNRLAQLLNSQLFIYN
jgi:hypothetical protein